MNTEKKEQLKKMWEKVNRLSKTTSRRIDTLEAINKDIDDAQVDAKKIDLTMEESNNTLIIVGSVVGSLIGIGAGLLLGNDQELVNSDMILEVDNTEDVLAEYTGHQELDKEVRI